MPNKGPFSSFEIVDSTTSRHVPHWSCIKISNNGKYILIQTRSEVLYVVDAFEGTIISRLTGHMNRTGLDLDANFTPDSQYVYSGSQDGNIYIWNLLTGHIVAKLEAHGEPCTAVAWNHKYLMFASADSDLVRCLKFKVIQSHI